MSNESDLKEFDQSVSLWQLIPSGQGSGLSMLKTIVDSIHNSSDSKLPSILITGPSGKRTHAKAFARALGLEQIKEIDASLLYPASGLLQFFEANQEIAYVITNAEKLSAYVQLAIYEICKDQKYTLYNFMKEGRDIFRVNGLLLTAKDIKKIAEPIVNQVDYIVNLEQHTYEQLKLVLLQRLKYANIDYEGEEVLTEIVKYGGGKLKDTIKVLTNCIAVIQAGSGNILQLKDVQKTARQCRLVDTYVPPPF